MLIQLQLSSQTLSQGCRGQSTCMWLPQQIQLLQASYQENSHKGSPESFKKEEEKFK